MARPKIPDEVKKREGALLREFFARAKDLDQTLSQEALISEAGFSQGLFAQWLSGKTRISDPNLVWLGRRLGFDPTHIRPELASYLDPQKMSDQERAILEAYRLDKSFRSAVNAMAEMSTFHRESDSKRVNKDLPDHD